MNAVYPGTDLLVRFCYDCQVEIEELSDLWVDFDSNCCVCGKCREKAWLDGHYPSFQAFELSIVPAASLDHEGVNEMQEG